MATSLLRTTAATSTPGEISAALTTPLARARGRVRSALLVTCGCGVMLSELGPHKSGGLVEWVRRFTDATSGW